MSYVFISHRLELKPGFIYLKFRAFIITITFVQCWFELFFRYRQKVVLEGQGFPNVRSSAERREYHFLLKNVMIGYQMTLLKHYLKSILSHDNKCNSSTTF